MMDFTLYVVDDEATITEGIKLALETEFQVLTFENAEAAIDSATEEPPDLMLLDIGLPGMSGVDALKKVRELFPDMLVVMITAYEDIDTVIASMKLGAHDYVIKPLHMDRLEVTIKNALDTIKLRKEVQKLQGQYLQENHPYFVGESQAILDVMAFVESVAKSPDTPLLLIGETGTGKELIASSIHYHSPNFKGPLTTVNCAAIPKELIESELFGYEKGAFSGARASGKKGLIEQAANGTLFLDEVGDLSLDAQAKLLRFLEEGEFYRVGGVRKLKVQTRVISATNKNMEEMIDQKLFRMDLYFRIGVIKIEIPSLNERRSDILLLAKHFLHAFMNKFGKNFTGLSKDAEQGLLEHTWTGNVRELKNMIERGALVGNGPLVTPVDLGLQDLKTQPFTASNGLCPQFSPIPESGVDLSSIENRLEKYYIEEAYRMANGNESKAAKLLNMVI